ncbi:MAG: beta-N-acetylglucosaminidase domain-containing protein [Limnochordaceae bacterium]|nr:beta-N-acetylglucosaminidase domain-containing protein [Limnochordaceae bacterium]
MSRWAGMAGQSVPQGSADARHGDLAIDKRPVTRRPRKGSYRRFLLLGLMVGLGPWSFNAFLPTRAHAAESATTLPSGPGQILPQVHQVDWKGSSGPVPTQIEVVTDTQTWQTLSGALTDLLRRLGDAPGQPLYRPAFSPAGEPLTDSERSISVSPTCVPTPGWGSSWMTAWATPPPKSSPSSARLFLVALGEQAGQELAAWSQVLTGSGLPALSAEILDKPAEGYTLSSGRLADGEAVVVAASRSPRGLLYAALTWAQLARATQGTPAAQLTDWPAYPIRGTIEGFYGPPWSPTDRLNQVAFYPWVRFNTYVYAPKDDPYHREKWRELYPSAELEQLRRLVELANRYQIDFVFAISPGLSVTFSSDQDFQALIAKTEQMRAIGVHRFALLLDDIPKTLRSPADQQQFKGDVGAAQAFLVNRYAAYLREKEPGMPLIVVPTDYYDLAPSAYKRTLATQVAPDVILYWTGVGVVAPVVTQAQATAAVRLWKHSILMWDNYPVNDYSRDTLYLGPLEGREDLQGAKDADHSFVGFTFNPMNEAEASKLPLATAADYAWNPAAYNPQGSWATALAQLVPPAAQPGFSLLARHYLSSTLHSEDALGSEIRSLLLSRLTDAQAQAEVDQLLEGLQALRLLGASLGNPALAQELAPYLTKLSLTGYLTQTYYNLIAAEQERQASLPVEADALRAEWQSRADWLTLFRQWQRINVRVGVLGEILNTVASRVAEPIALFSGTGPKASSSLSAYQSFTADQLADGRDDTFFWSGESPQAGDWFGIDIGRSVPVKTIRIAMGSTQGAYARPEDYLHQYEVRISNDGSSWQTVGRFVRQREASVSLPEGTHVRYIRVVATAAQTNWVQVRELSVEPKPAAFDITLAGGQLATPVTETAGLQVASQPAETGSTQAVPTEAGQSNAQPAPASPVPMLAFSGEPAAVLDGDPATAIQVQPVAPAPDSGAAAPVWLTVTVPAAAASQEWGGLALLLGAGATGQLTVETTVDGNSWKTVGAISPDQLARGGSWIWQFDAPLALKGYRLRWQPAPAASSPPLSSPGTVGAAADAGVTSAPSLSVREFYPLPPDYARPAGEGV